MPPLTLPPQSPTSLRAFWLVVSTGFGLATATTIAAVRGDRRLLALAFPVAMANAIPGLRDPRAVDTVYRAWNRLGREVGAGSSRYVTRVAYEALRITRHLGAQPPIHRRSPGRSGWIPRRTQPAASYRQQDALGSTHERRDAFDRYARRPENAWAESIRPLVRLLSMIDTEEDADKAPPADVYTLY